MTAEKVEALEEEIAALKEANDALYRQHANEKAQMQLAIEQEKIQVSELLQANTAYCDENDQWRMSYDALEMSKRESDEAWEAMKRDMEEKIAVLEESVKSYTDELVSDLHEMEKEKSEIASRDETIEELQRQLNETSGRFSQLITEYDEMSITFQQQGSDFAAREQHFSALESELRDRVNRLQGQIAQRESQLKAKSQDDEVKEVNQHALFKRAQEEIAEKDSEISLLTQKIQQLEEEVSLLSLTGGVGGDGKNGANVMITLRDLQQQLFQKSEELVQQGEKNLQFSANYEKQKQLLQTIQLEVDGVRSTLLRGIIGDGVDETAYKHVKLDELVRLRLKAVENDLRVLNATNKSSMSYGARDSREDQSIADGEDEENAERPSTHLANVESFSAVDNFGAVGRMERELRLAKSRNKRLQSHIDQLEKEVEVAMSNLNDFQALKEKMVEIVSRERVEKELRVKTESSFKEATDKIVALSEHIEKLMVHLKHEAAAKTKAVDLHRRTDKELSDCKEKLAVMTKKNAIKDQQIQELEQGAKILEDQLRLMDEKFIDVRNKLDWTRATSQKEMKRLQGELNTLRMKWQMANDMGALSSLPDWVNTPKIKPKSKPLGASSSDSRLTTTTSNNAPTSPTTNLSPLRNADPYTMRFDIPRLPQPDSEAGTPWSDAKLNTLQRQLQEKRQV